MSTETEPPAPRHASPVARAILGGATLLLALWVGVRVAEAVSAKRAVARADAPAAVSSGERPARASETVRGEPRAWAPEVAFEGSLYPARETDLAFSATGRMARVGVRVGTVVKEGQVLATLDDRMAAAQARAAEAQIRAAEAQLGLAVDAATRTRSLVDSGTVGEAAGVSSHKQRELATAQVDAAKAQLALARAQQATHAIVAPFAGTITMSPSAPGAVVGPGVTVFHLVDTTHLSLTGTISDVDAALVKVGHKVEIQNGGRPLSGVVLAVLPAMDASTRRVRVIADVPNDPDAPVLGGSFARATIRGALPLDVLRLPSSVLRAGSQDEVLVRRGGAVESRRVSFVAGAGEILVRAGLSATDDVIVAPPPLGTDASR